MFSDFMPAVLLVFAVSADAFISSFAYGAKRIKIPFASVTVITVICSGVLALSLYAGELLRPLLPGNAANILCFLILFILGFIKLLDNVIKSIIKKYNRINGRIKFKLLSLHFILNVYANPEDADEDKSKTLSPAEAASLAVALSLDGLAAGVGTALGGANKPLIIVMSLFTGLLAIILGCFAGNKAADSSSKDNFSWVGGAGLIALAVYKLF
jgi:putative sporulation protein YtaF